MNPDDHTQTRRRFLAATAAASVTALAGCNESGDRTGTATGSPTDGGTAVPTTGDTPTTGTPPTGTTPTTTAPPVDFEGYPYGVDESRVEAARKVMEDAGYGPDDRYELHWHQYRSPSLRAMADAIRSRLRRAHVDMRISQGWYVLQHARKGKADAFTLGWIADYPAAENFLRLVDPPNTNYRGGHSADGVPFYWTADSHHGEGRGQAMAAADRLRNNPEPTAAAAEARASAVRRMEEAIWADVPMVATHHGVAEPVWYDRVDWPLPGALGESRRKKNRISVAGTDRLDLINRTITTLDPVQSADDAGATVITQVFDAPTAFRNATTTVDPLLIADYETSEDFTTYTFTLKEGVQFHGDFGEVTADDVVYSFRRLAESPNSNRVEYLADFLGVSHRVVAVRTGADGDVVDRVRIPSAKLGTGAYADYERERIVPRSVAVEATGEYEVRIGLDAPSAHVLSLLAYPAFSVVPEGIVGDVDGYDGELTHEAFATRTPVGCGPFTFGEWAEGDEVYVDRFADYHGHTPEVERVRWAIIENGTAAYEYFREGNADVGRIPNDRYGQSNVSIDRTDALGRQIGTYGPLGNDETVNYARIPELSTFYVGFNCENVPLPVRKAVAYVANVAASVDDHFEGRALPAYHLTPPNLFPGGPDGYERHYRG